TTPPRVAALALAAGVAALALPGAASAAVTPQFSNGTLTLNGNEAADTITLTVSGGNIAHNFPTAPGALENSTDFDPGPGITTVPSNGTVNLVVNGGAGNDNINVAAPAFAGTPVINGDDGDDTIIGTPRTDQIAGGAGNDRITGGKNTLPGDTETINGNDGNDVIIWNNGDGNDRNEGGNGVDETLIVEGTADDNNIASQNGTVTHFERTNAGIGFTVDSNLMEKLTLQSFSGNDTLSTAPGVPLGMNIDAGPGNDTITTGDGPDRILGDRGNDTLNGAGGDDTLVWTNGDGDDVMNGDAGFDTIENDLGNADDNSFIKLENGRVRYDRINAPFNLSIGSAELMQLNTFGGNDTLHTAQDVTMNLDVNGGSGNDVLDGSLGNDRLDGGDGDDTLATRDGKADFVVGGAGADTALIDNFDAAAGDVENVQSVGGAPAPVPAPGPSAGAASLAKTAKVAKGVASIKVSCPAGTAGCKGSVALFSSSAIKVGQLKAKLELGRASYTVGAGQSKTIKVKLASGTAKLAKKKKLAVTARVVSDGAGESSSKLTLSF
ncbi:MAG TPA: calcium-binding protein, partial [Solirubrobacter sp.]